MKIIIKTLRDNVYIQLTALTLLFLFLLFSGCAPTSGNNDGQGEIEVPAEPEPEPDPEEEPLDAETKLLNDTFRIDIETIDVIFDYRPEEAGVDCRATVVFKMRPGQDRAIIHLTPAERDPDTVSEILLNGERLDITDFADVRLIGDVLAGQRAFEFQRVLAEEVQHTLEISYHLSGNVVMPEFMTDVYDPGGFGNERIFPTINTPHELARHTLTFRVHDRKPYRCIGSGLVVRNEASQVQEWKLDTEREIASYTIMFVVAEEEDTVYAEQTVAGVDVRVMGYTNGPDIDVVFPILENWLPELNTNLGPFPMPRGLSLFITRMGGGMEYYGASITSINALEHEVFHMYYACSTVNKTYRDSWLDESITVWYARSKSPEFLAIEENYTSDIVSGRTPVSLGFDMRAYSDGARIMQAVAVELGGRQQMVDFLSYLYTNYAFKPFTTREFLDYLDEYSGVDMRERFDGWVYSVEPVSSAVSGQSAPVEVKERVNTTPPPGILEKRTLRKQK